MKCRDVREAVLRGRARSTSGVQEHLKACTPCGSLASELTQTPLAYAGPKRGTSEAELDALWQRVESAIEREKGPAAWLRSMPTRWRIVLAAIAALAMAIALGVASPRVDLDVYPQARLLLAAGSFTALLGALIILNLRPLQRPDLSTRALIFAFTALVLPFSIALLPEARLAHPVAFHDAHDCLLLGTLCGAALMALLRVLDRSTSGGRAVLVPAAAGGMLANLALSFHCPVVNPLHLAVIHAPIGLVLFFAYKSVRFTKVRIARVRGG